MEEKGYRVGKLLRSVREAMKVSQKAVCEGLCSQNAYMRIERGEIEPKPYLLVLLFQRLGTSINKYGLVYTQKEYEELLRREEIVEYLAQASYEGLPELLAEYEQVVSMTNYQQQFVDYVRLLLSYYQGEKRAKEMCEEALATLHLTVPAFSFEERQIRRYTRIEILLVALVAECAYQARERQEAIRIWKELIQAIEQTVDDREEWEVRYPDLAWLLTERLWEQGCYEEREYCDRAIRLLRENQKILGLLPLLRCRQESWKQDRQSGIDEKKIAAYEERIVALEKMDQKYAGRRLQVQDVFWRSLKNMTQGISMAQLFRGMRESTGMTEMKLSEELDCAPETISRIENGAMAPRSENYQTMLEYFGRDGYRYYPNIVSDEYADHILFRQISIHNRNLQYEEAELGKINGVESEQRLWEALHLTIPRTANLSKFPLTHTEVKILNGIALARQRQGKTESAVELLYQVKQACERNPLLRQDMSGMYFVVLYNLIRFLGRMDRFEKAKEMAEEYVGQAYQADMGFDFIAKKYLAVWNQEKMLIHSGSEKEMIKERCYDEFKEVLLAAEAAKQSVVIKVAKKYCEKYEK